MELDSEGLGQPPERGQRRFVVTGFQASDVRLAHPEFAGELGLGELVLASILDHLHCYLVSESSLLPLSPVSRILQVLGDDITVTLQLAFTPVPPVGTVPS